MQTNIVQKTIEEMEVEKVDSEEEDKDHIKQEELLGEKRK